MISIGYGGRVHGLVVP